ncbi:MAG: exonuclease domain-containing protein, partial [Gemmataceae bacterium]|nr:exonuclease domain-containing protein [Gemmataceae bacterium]
MSLVAVLDVETTGLVPARERIIEIGIVLLNSAGQVEAELESLINPQRDVGPSHIHQVYARDVQNAPTFADFAGE